MKPEFPFALPDDHDRLAEVGRIAGPLVHELKNPLGTILLNAELLQQQKPFAPDEQERADKRLGRIVDSARNLQRIIQSFLAFARPSRPDRDAVDVNALIHDLLDEQREALAAAKAKVHFAPDPALALVPADRQQLRSIILNVIDNAREALAGRERDRRLLVVTRAAPGLARIVIANNGPPLSEQIAAHLFEPFRSSKENGTGLGLAIVHRLVELHRGTVQVSSDPDQGVSFTFEFPTPLGPAQPRVELPMPAVEASVRDSSSHVPRRPDGSPRPTSHIPVAKTRSRRKPRPDAGRGTSDVGPET